MERHTLSTREHALALLRSGKTNRAVADQLQIPYGTVSWWLHEHRKAQGVAAPAPHPCLRCQGMELPAAAYSYLLGLYLGDGHIVSKPKQRHLSIFCANVWPGIITATEETMRIVMPSAQVSRVTRAGCTEVKSYNSHWPCLFPQHGPGRKHERRITLEKWQQEIVDQHPWEFIRGLLHSDGCRVTNWTVRTVRGEPKRYEYPRYLFTNKSEDILGLYCAALDRVGVEWRTTRRGKDPYNISVARRRSVALMDEHVGAKH